METAKQDGATVAFRSSEASAFSVNNQIGQSLSDQKFVRMPVRSCFNICAQTQLHEETVWVWWFLCLMWENLTLLAQNPDLNPIQHPYLRENRLLHITELQGLLSDTL